MGIIINQSAIPRSYLDTDTSLAANSDRKVASQKATKSYIDSAISAENLWDRSGTALVPHTAGDTIGVTGTRIASGWFTDLTVTNAIAGSVTGTAGNVSGTPALPDGTAATTQALADNTTKLATTAFVQAATGGAWVTPAFDAANFTANGSMTWTVDAGDVITYAYTICGKTMTVAFSLNATTVGGTLNSRLYIAIPASKTATKTMTNNCATYQSGWLAGLCSVDAGTTFIYITRDVVETNFEASTNGTLVKGQITFEIN